MKRDRPRITILTTTAAGPVVPGIIQSLRESRRFEYRVVGVDAKPGGVGAEFADVYHVVPMGNEGEKYFSAIFELCRREGVDVVLPISDEEVLTLSLYKQFFESIGVGVLCNEYEITRTALRKDYTLEKLESHGIETPGWYAPHNMNLFDKALSSLGFPDSDVVVKPVSARGSRGFRIIKKEFDEFSRIYMEKEEIYIKPDRLRRILAGQRKFPSLLLMEYLPGDSWNVDVFAEKGNARCIVPHKRQGYRWGNVDRALLTPDPEVCSLCRRIVAAFGFDHLINIELNKNSEGRLQLVEINPRASATLAQNRLAGLNLLDMAVAASLGYSVSVPGVFDEGEYILYWSDVMVGADKH